MKEGKIAFALKYVKKELKNRDKLKFEYEENRHTETKGFVTTRYGIDGRAIVEGETNSYRVVDGFAVTISCTDRFETLKKPVPNYWTDSKVLEQAKRETGYYETTLNGAAMVSTALLFGGVFVGLMTLNPLPAIAGATSMVGVGTVYNKQNKAYKGKVQEIAARRFYEDVAKMLEEFDEKLSRLMEREDPGLRLSERAAKVGNELSSSLHAPNEASISSSGSLTPLRQGQQEMNTRMRAAANDDTDIPEDSARKRIRTDRPQAELEDMDEHSAAESSSKRARTSMTE